MSRRASSGWVTTLTPSMVASPTSGAMTVYKMRSVVDLPAPLGPSNPVMRPSCARKVTSRTAVTRPKCFWRLLASITEGSPGLGRRAADRHKKRHRPVILNARDIQALDPSTIDEVRHSPVDTGGRQLSVTEALQDHMHAVCERAPGVLRIARWRHGIVTP